MADVHNTATRSFNMSKIRSKNTKPEILVRKYLFSEGFRFRLHSKSLPGKPDIILSKYRTVLFINGCFWHGHEGCKYFVIPKTRTKWWTDKIKTTRVSDAQHKRVLKDKGWQVFTIFECKLRPSLREKTLNKLKAAILS
ncbi:MAG: DNA mismatch endonuclease Vsr [Cyclobacteriaceae bacterium]|nr:DNA mismatch endonuclease Vsr [Cyclobacteriaceae bacterium]